MNWDAVGAVAELIGGVATVATLAYLATQIRQATAATRAEIRQSIADSQIHYLNSRATAWAFAAIWWPIFVSLRITSRSTGSAPWMRAIERLRRIQLGLRRFDAALRGLSRRHAISLAA